MMISCNDRERIFMDGTPEEWAALEVHAKTCVACAEEVQAWKALGVAAQEMRDYQESPTLWPRIEKKLAEEAEKLEQSRRRWSWLTGWSVFAAGWQVAAAAVLVLALTVSASWVYLHQPAPPKNAKLLKSKALQE